MQAEAAPPQVARGRRQCNDQPQRLELVSGVARRQQSTAEETHEYRDADARVAREELPRELEADVGGGVDARRRPPDGQGGGARLVLQPAPETEEDQPAAESAERVRPDGVDAELSADRRWQLGVVARGDVRTGRDDSGDDTHNARVSRQRHTGDAGPDARQHGGEPTTHARVQCRPGERSHSDPDATDANE